MKDEKVDKEIWDLPFNTQYVSSSSILATSPGGEHYRKQAIEPIVYIEQNHIPFHEGNIIKYVTRWRDKNGIEDLRKAKFYIERLIELEEGKHNEG